MATNNEALKAHVVAELNALTIYELINAIDCPVNKVANEDGSLRAGADYVDTIRVLIAEAVEYSTDEISGDIAREDNYADNALPVYYDDLFEAVSDLRAWHVDVEDFLTGITEVSLDNVARLAIWTIGQRLTEVLADTIDELVENYEEN